ncbi:Formamidopyrimidine-DNA glycosylase [Chondromyces apiculatus DSM 436]|uniref:Formamidopyrimidine-DNA glycosylase n=1 Tax=Chondromyces apiculatus DSM 436 TaxID=1192034 RepID=A0A017TCA4_9BACT|nr:Formamidopyrimidine-DNA glycosylase [Chondromyces apiculatus DSM 436]
MPELPEVEHTARALAHWLTGQRIEGAEADPTRMLRGQSPRAFARMLKGRTLDRVERRGKAMLLTFDADAGLLSHLGMTGRWLRRLPGEPPPRHSRARIYLPQGVVLHNDDPRMFGRLLVAPASTLPALPDLLALGPDPLRDGVDASALGQAFARTTRPVKVALMDPTVIAGVGNIQATEALFRAGVHPARPAHGLAPDEVAAVAAGIEASITHTLASLAAQPEVAYLGSGLAPENPFLVYDRAGTPCPRCSTTLDKMTLGGRTSAYCPRCQPRCQPRRARRRRATSPSAGP